MKEQNITISSMQSVSELSSLRRYDKATMDLLKKNFKLKDSLYLVAKKGEEVIGFCSVDRGWWEENFFFVRWENPRWKEGVTYRLGF